MSKRDLIFAGIRLIGIYLLVFGFLDLLLKSATFIYNYHAIQAAMFQTLGEPMTSDELFRSMLRQVQNVEIGAKIIWDLARIIIGWYFCKGGKRVIDFLSGKEEISPPTNS